MNITERSVSFARPCDGTDVRISYIDSKPSDPNQQSGTILLIHGFPLTKRQFRYVFPLFAKANYRMIAPDYTGAGGSSKPESNYTKSAIAGDLAELLKVVAVTDKVYVVAHDIGGMIGHAFVSAHPDRVKCAVLGECPQPGTKPDDEVKGDVGHFHFNFHAHTDLAVALVSGKEDIYLRYFFDKQAYHRAAITDEDIDAFVKAYSQPGALRAAFLTYKDLNKDREENSARVKDIGKCKVPVLAMCGARSHWGGGPGLLLKELYEHVEETEIPESGHYIAMENPEKFVAQVVSFLGKY
ncbi:hypothetical protein B9Z65_6693 [Elsinoe australis]|uniref:AB hydrolase-1 domain-containing protein n=1 Tax=Elsinoe australis TaxID=40998 RepID=A0A2P8AE04_9PEZI|nr:hypothetical protein B9Z65_6693 [Elsinoe australis]